MRYVAARFVPRLMTESENQHRIEVYEDVPQRANNDHTYLPNIIPGDEIWVNGSEVELSTIITSSMLWTFVDFFALSVAF